MDKFLMICYVAADFFSPDREIFRVTPDKLGTFIQAPSWVRDTLLFRGLVNDGSIRVAEDRPTQKKLENDPAEGILADGRAAEPVEVNVEAEAKKRTRKKKDDAQ